MANQNPNSTACSNFFFYDQDYVVEPFGIGNTGAICWLNSLLQSFLGCSSFNQVMLQCEDKFANNELGKEYIGLIKQLLPSNEKSVKNVSGHLLSTFSLRILNAMMFEIRRQKITPVLRNQQEGCADGFLMFLELLDCPEVYNVFLNKYELSIKCENCKEITSTNNDKNPFINLHCGKQMNNDEDFAKFIKAHLTTVDVYTCEKCNTVLKNVNRLCKLKMLREVIPIIYDKHHADNNKWYPMQIKFKSLDNTYLVYDLIGTIEHGGHLDQHNYSSSGHYSARAIHGDTFYSLNDEFVSPTDYKYSDRSFILFYHITNLENIDDV